MKNNYGCQQIVFCLFNLNVFDLLSYLGLIFVKNLGFLITDLIFNVITKKYILISYIKRNQLTHDQVMIQTFKNYFARLQ